MPEFRTDSDTTLPEEVAQRWLEAHPASGAAAADLQAFFAGYVSALLWTATWDTDSGDAPEDHDNADIEVDAAMLTQLADHALAFCAAELGDLIAYARLRSWSDAGHDFALTRNRHGAGFWDRGLGDLGERLTTASKPYGEQSVQARLDEDGDVLCSIIG